MRAVAGRGRMTLAGYQPENHESMAVLTVNRSNLTPPAPDTGPAGPDDVSLRDRGVLGAGRRVGRDPGTIDLAELTAAGHPRCRAQSVVSRMNIYGDRDDDAKRLNGLTLKGLRARYCYPCRPSEDSCSDGVSRSGIRECAIIDCPVWPYRLGFNPHNPMRGKDPFEESRHG